MSTSNEEFTPNGRSRSNISQNFPASLNESFAIDSNPKLQGLLQSVEQKKQAVSSQSQELEALEAKLRETEARLKQKTKLSETSSAVETTSSARRKPVPSTSDRQEHSQAPAGGDTPLAAQAASTADSAPSPMYARWEGLMPQRSQ